jgi:hypothetical protein
LVLCNHLHVAHLAVTVEVNPATFGRLLGRFGLTYVRIRYFDFLYSLTPAPLVPLVECLGRVVERTPLVAEVAGSPLIVARAPAA